MGIRETKKKTQRKRMKEVGKNPVWISSFLLFFICFALCPTQTTVVYGEGMNADPLSMKRLHFGMLPKGVPIPPSGPSRRSSIPSPPPPPLIKPSNLNFGMLPKGVPIPPSVPSRRSPPPFSKGLSFGMLPKGVPIPPSGPSERTSEPPSPLFKKRRLGTFGMLHKRDPTQPSTPSYFHLLHKGPVPPSGPSIN